MGANAAVTDEIDERELARQKVEEFFDWVAGTGEPIDAVAIDLAKKIGTDRTTVYRWRRAESRPMPVFIPLLRKALPELKKRIKKS